MREPYLQSGNILWAGWVTAWAADVVGCSDATSDAADETEGIADLARWLVWVEIAGLVGGLTEMGSIPIRILLALLLSFSQACDSIPSAMGEVRWGGVGRNCWKTKWINESTHTFITYH